MRDVFLDTAPLIYLLETRGDRQKAIQNQLQEWIRNGALFVSSVLTLTELLTGPRRDGNERLADQYRVALSQLLGRPLLTIDEKTANHAASLRSRFRLRTPDALQLAAAVQSGCAVFYTNDKRLRECSDIEVVLVE